MPYLKLEEQVCCEIRSSQNEKDLNDLFIRYLGKKGVLNNILVKLRNLPSNERQVCFNDFNLFKKNILNLFELKKKYFNSLQCDFDDFYSKEFDFTLPGRGFSGGSLHSISHVIIQMEDFFTSIGYVNVYGLDIEDEYHNFEALCIKKIHPARSIQDTFYLRNNLLLRTHTSSIQIRLMENNYPPFRLFSIGRVYRVDSDVVHTPMFHQLEVLIVDTDVNFSYLKWVLSEFLTMFFGNVLTRFRSSYFPFTQPSAEVDIECFKCKGVGCFLCSNTGWIEILGCGIIQPSVLRSCKINYEKYTGFAFGVGVDRLAMLKFCVDDLRINFENDIRFLEQF